MKLAEALNFRADAQRKLSELNQRLQKNAQVQDGEKPAEDPKVLLTEYEEVLAEYTGLVKRINKSNNTVEFESGKSLMEAIAERDALASKKNAWTNLKSAATLQQDRYSRTEIKFVSTIDVIEAQKTIDALAKEFRKIDSQIQQLNWKIDLLD
jgi:hypothetical protein